jgi:adenylate cyclase
LKETVAAQTHECLGVFGRGIERYLAQDWDAAEKEFTLSATLEPNQPGKTPGVEGNPSLTLISRCRYLRDHSPGREWNGVFVMKEK